MVSCSDPGHYAPLRDLAGAVFTLLPHTPVTALGLNRLFHFQMPSIEAWHSIGHILAPKEPWDAILDKPGLRSMLMEGRRKATDGGLLHIKVEPSVRVEHGVFIEINEEFKEPGEGAQWVLACLADHWDATMKFAAEAAEHLLGLVKK